MPHWRPGRWQSTLNTNILKTVLSVVYHAFGKLCVARTQTSDSSFCCPVTASSLPRTGMPCIMGEGKSAKCGCCQRERAGERQSDREKHRDIDKNELSVLNISLFQKRDNPNTQNQEIQEQSYILQTKINIENFILFFQEVLITKPESVKRNIE